MEPLSLGFMKAESVLFCPFLLSLVFYSPGAAVVSQQGVRGADRYREAVPQGAVHGQSFSQL